MTGSIRIQNLIRDSLNEERVIDKRKLPEKYETLQNLGLKPNHGSIDFWFRSFLWSERRQIECSEQSTFSPSIRKNKLKCSRKIQVINEEKDHTTCSPTAGFQVYYNNRNAQWSSCVPNVDSYNKSVVDNIASNGVPDSTLTRDTTKNTSYHDKPIGKR